MFKTAYPLFLNSTQCESIDSKNGKFIWTLDTTITPQNRDVLDLEFQFHSLQLSRQFKNCANGGNVLTFQTDVYATNLYTITIPEKYYATITEIITAFNAVANAFRVSDNFALPTPLRLVDPAGTDRIIKVYVMTAFKIHIQNTGLALRIGMPNESFTVLATNISTNQASFNGTIDLNYPKYVYICSDNSLLIDISNDSSPTAHLRVLVGLPVNCDYGSFIPLNEPFFQTAISKPSYQLSRYCII